MTTRGKIGMDKLFERFAYSDFVAYLLPGCLSLLFIFLTVGQFGVLYINTASVNTFNVTLFLFAGYIWGVIQSGFSYWFDSYNVNPTNVKKILNSIDDEPIEQTAHEAFLAIFGSNGKLTSDWSSQHYFLARSYVQLHSPILFENANCQNGLRQMRLYLLPTVFIGYLSSISYSLNITNIWYLLGYVSVVFFVFYKLLKNLINRSRLNRVREKREILCALIVLSVPRKINEESIIQDSAMNEPHTDTNL